MTDISRSSPVRQSASSTAPVSAEPTLGDVLLDFWAARVWLLAGIIVALLGAFVFLGLAVPQYKTSMIVSPSTVDNAAVLPSSLPENAGFALESLFRSFNPEESADFMRFETLIREDTVASKLLEDPRVVEGLEESKRFTVIPQDIPGTPADLTEWLQDHLSVEPVRETPLKEISILHPSPRFGPYLLSRIHVIADSHIREERRQRTRDRIGWLKKELAQTDHPEHRRILTSLLLDQEQKAIILSIEEPYAALVTEPPSVSAEPRWPRKYLVIGLFILAGLFSGYAAYSLRRSAVNQKAQGGDGSF